MKNNLIYMNLLHDTRSGRPPRETDAINHPYHHQARIFHLNYFNGKTTSMPPSQDTITSLGQAKNTYNNSTKKHAPSYCFSITNHGIINSYENDSNYNMTDSNSYSNSSTTQDNNSNEGQPFNTSIDGTNDFWSNIKQLYAGFKYFESFLSSRYTTTNQQTEQKDKQLLDEYISQQDLAKLLGVSQRTIREYARRYDFKRALKGKKVYYFKTDFINKFTIKPTT